MIRTKVVAISWRLEVISALDQYAESLTRKEDGRNGFSWREGRSSLVNNLVARELTRLGHPIKTKGGKSQQKGDSRH